MLLIKVNDHVSISPYELIGWLVVGCRVHQLWKGLMLLILKINYHLSVHMNWLVVWSFFQMQWAGLCNDFDSVVVWIQWILQWIFGPLELLTIVSLFHNHRCKKRQIYIVLLFSLQDAANFFGHAQIHRNKKRKHCASTVCYQDGFHGRGLVVKCY